MTYNIVFFSNFTVPGKAFVFFGKSSSENRVDTVELGGHFCDCVA